MSPVFCPPTFSPILEISSPPGKRTSKILVVVAHGKGLVVLCEDSSALRFVEEFGSGASCDGFVPEENAVALEIPKEGLRDGVYIAELRVVDGGPESWEMPHVRDYYAEIRDFRPATPEEWSAHLAGEWPEGFDLPGDRS